VTAGFFSAGQDPEEQDASRERIQRGGIPLAAEERLRALGGEGAMFTSGLSVSEFSLLRRLGPRPIAHVMGASVVRPAPQLLPALAPGQANLVVGRAYGPQVVGASSWNRITDASPSQVFNYKWHTEVICQLDVLTAAWDTARRRALARLTQEAQEVGADAVAGVHLRRGEHDFGGRTVQYVVSGTAIRLGESQRDERPTLMDLSVQDLWRLDRAGYDAVGLLAASVVVFASPPTATRLRRRRSPRQNQELGELSQGFQLARGVLRERLRGQVADARADGAVGVEFMHEVQREKLSLASSLGSLDRRGWHLGRFGIPYYVSGRGEAERRGWMITMHASGTAVTRRRAGVDDVKTALRIGAR